jgi:hypothetical protein
MGLPHTHTDTQSQTHTHTHTHTHARTHTHTQPAAAAATSSNRISMASHDLVDDQREGGEPRAAEAHGLEAEQA